MVVQENVNVNVADGVMEGDIVDVTDGDVDRVSVAVVDFV